MIDIATLFHQIQLSNVNHSFLNYDRVKTICPEKAREIFHYVIVNFLLSRTDKLFSLRIINRFKMLQLIVMIVLVKLFNESLVFNLKKNYTIWIVPLINSIKKLIQRSEQKFFELQERRQILAKYACRLQTINHYCLGSIKSKFINDNDNVWLRFYRSTEQNYFYQYFLEMYPKMNIYKADDLTEYVTRTILQNSMFLSEENYGILTKLSSKIDLFNTDSVYALRSTFIIDGSPGNHQDVIISELASLFFSGFMNEFNFTRSDFMIEKLPDEDPYDYPRCLNGSGEMCYIDPETPTCDDYGSDCILRIPSDRTINVEFIRRWLLFNKNYTDGDSLNILCVDDFDKISRYFPPDIFTCKITVKNADRYQLNKICDVVKSTSYYQNNLSAQIKLEKYIENFVEYADCLETVIKQIIETVTRDSKGNSH